MSLLKTHIDSKGVLKVNLGRPEVHNAFNAQLISELSDVFAVMGRQASVRAIVLCSDGKSFSAGADLDWMKAAASASVEDNHQDALAMTQMFHTLNSCPKPVIGLVQGAAFGGGVGLVACCDIVLAAPRALFALTEVKLGLIPGVISPFVIAKIGVSAARRYFLTAETFDAHEALRLGLIHKVSEDLHQDLNELTERLRHNGPEAMSEAKALVQDVAALPMGPELLDLTASKIAKRRVSKEGQEGMSAYFEKRSPSWLMS